MENKKIAFIGIDGSGKSALIKELEKLIEKDYGECHVVYMGLGKDMKIPFLKKLMKVYSKKKYGSESEESYHKSRDNLRDRSPLWLFVQYSEFWARYLGARKLQKDKIILFDRFFYDGLILGSNLSFSIFRHFTPVPNKCFLIKAPPKIIRERKDEASEEDIIKYYKKSKRVLKFFPIVEIDNTKNLKVVAREIYDMVFEGEIKSLRGLKKQRTLFRFLDARGVKYVATRGFSREDILKNKDLDILLSKTDYSLLIKNKIPNINREIHFYPGEEKHFGIKILGEDAIPRGKLDSELGFFVLSLQDRLRMKFFRSFLKIGRFIKKCLGFYNKNEKD